MKKMLTSLAFAVALSGFFGSPVAGLAAGLDDQTWSIVAHFQYVDGFEFDYTVATGVPTAQVHLALAECGRGHQHGAGAVVRFHCYPVAE